MEEHTHTHPPQRKAQHFLRMITGFSLWWRQGGGAVRDTGVEGVQLPWQGLRHFRHHRVISVPARLIFFLLSLLSCIHSVFPFSCYKSAAMICINKMPSFFFSFLKADWLLPFLCFAVSFYCFVVVVFYPVFVLQKTHTNFICFNPVY